MLNSSDLSFNPSSVLPAVPLRCGEDQEEAGRGPQDDAGNAGGAGEEQGGDLAGEQRRPTATEVYIASSCWRADKHGFQVIHVKSHTK